MFITLKAKTNKYEFCQYSVTDNGEAVESRSALPRVISYIPYGEIFVEQQSGGWQSPYLFNAKELDSETGLYYYGARYLDPSEGMWLSVDPLWEKYAGANPYNYCLGNPIICSDYNGLYRVVMNDNYQTDENGNEERIGWCVEKDGKYYKYYSEDNISETPLDESQVTDFMRKVADDFDDMKKSRTGTELYSFYEGKGNNAYIHENPEENCIEAANGFHIGFNGKNDHIPTTMGDDPKYSPSWISLAHELAHRKDYLLHGAESFNSIWTYSFYGKKIIAAEKYATHVENIIRGEVGLPLRTFYEDGNNSTQLLKSYHPSKSLPTIWTNESLYYKTDQFVPLPYKY